MLKNRIAYHLYIPLNNMTNVKNRIAYHLYIPLNNMTNEKNRIAYHLYTPLNTMTNAANPSFSGPLASCSGNSSRGAPHPTPGWTTARSTPTSRRARGLRNPITCPLICESISLGIAPWLGHIGPFCSEGHIIRYFYMQKVLYSYTFNFHAKDIYIYIYNKYINIVHSHNWTGND